MTRSLSRSLPLSISLFASFLAVLAPASARAATFAWCDDSTSIAIADGAIGGSEYPGASTGVNSGFGAMIGAGVELYVDGDAAGSLAFGIDATGGTCAWSVNDTLVIYVDSLPGVGASDTTGFTDFADAGRAAASGANASGRADLTFATGFGADYAIVIRGDSASLFQLVPGTSHVFVASLTRAPSAGFASACVKELDGISMADLGSAPGNPFRWVATLLNPSDASGAFRSNEFQGVADGTASGGNIGVASFALAGGDYDTFVSYGPEVGVAGAFRWLDFAAYAGAGLVPAPTCGQVSSNSFLVQGLSDGATTFGGSFTTGDYARGVNAGTAATAGLYAFEVGPSDRAFGVTPAGTDFTPGDITIAVRNDGTAPLRDLQVGYVIQVLNSQARANSFNFSSSTDGSTFTPVASLDYTSPELADIPAAWTSVPRGTALTGVDVAVGGSLYLRWSGDDVSGAGSRDRFGLDDLVLRPVFAACGDGVIDTGESCDDGSANGTTTSCCAVDCTYRAAGTACGGGGGGGACDLADTCDGAGACIDRFDSTTVCRPSVGACDAAETCDGTGPSCPVDAAATAGTACRASTGTCDLGATCDGSSTACPASAPATAGTPCRATAGACDVAETCDGTSLACPADGVATAGTACRAAAGACDVADTCDGSSAACPADSVATAGTSCRTAAGACDLAESCDGSSAACPADSVATAGTSCRAAVDACDVAESCDGSSTGCPADGVAAAGTTCRAMAGACDVTESCDGSSTGCPADGLATAGTACRAAAGACDVLESCDGSSAACPADGVASAGASCRAAAGACDVEETCDGSAATCPAVASQPDGTACGDGTACNGDEVCASGTCAAGTAVDCDDGDACTMDMCVEPGGTCDYTDICVDAGVDASVPMDDASVPMDDASVPMDDASVPMGDASVPMDDGGEADAALDAGTVPRTRDDGGCGCRTTAPRPAPGAGWLSALAIAALAFRRWRRPRT